jgi:hypothetical protein
MAIDWVSESMTPKNRKKCQTSVTVPRSSMLVRYRAPAITIMRLLPYLSPNQPLIGANNAPTR